MALSRRSFLGLSAAGTALLAVGGLGLWPTTLRAPQAPLQVLTPRAYSVLAAVADRLCPGGGAFPSASQLGVAEKLDALFAMSDPSMGAELNQALLLLDNALAGLLLDQHPATFTASGPEAQDRILAAWAGSGIALRRKVFKALRGLVAGTYYGDPRVYAAMGYPGPPSFDEVNP